MSENRNIGFVLTVLLAVVACGCARLPSQVVRKSPAQLDAMAATAASARTLFHQSEDLASAQRLFAGMATERHASQPLYLCELASIALLRNDRAAAGRYLQEAVMLLDRFYDQATEREAASLWGSEASKVYKGDPYERATLYLLYGLWLLENGDAEKALVSFKRGLLMDGDTEHATYQADYGLLFFLAAKCHDLRGEHAQRDAMLLGTFRAYMSLPDVAQGFAAVATAEYFLACHDGEPAAIPPSPWLRRIAGWGNRSELENRGIRGPVLEWLERHRMGGAEQMAFNVLAMVWNGQGPTMMRGGKYGQTRLIACMEPPVQPLQYAMTVNNNQPQDMLQWLGNLNFQASTRGGRRMDDRLATQAMIKGATEVTGLVMVGAGMGMMYASDEPDVQLAGMGMMLGGVFVDAVGQLMNPQADIRCWQCLPAEFTVLPLQLSPGEQRATIAASCGTTPWLKRSASFTVSSTAPVSVWHARGPSWPGGKAAARFGAYHDVVLQLLLEAGGGAAWLDRNGDGEMTAAERSAVEKEIIRMYDSNGDGRLSEQEANSALQAIWGGK
ncbi:MAG: EF-hand domain-containing protein [Lentisphaerae bacterium]|nr:EF-hand domain-containing protein [Lentisphaerota bacterium]OQC17372.1 MAG: hypothetical protein BWX73_00192 [Lentisphaerae bacterium ADurb.Bin082]HQL87420.1 EF-hand domain-containing protein [Lentisphaeria bacterium]